MSRRVKCPLITVLGVVLVVMLVRTVPWLLRPARTDLSTELFQGVTYIRHARSTPRPLMIHIVEIDLSAPGIGFLVTPGDESSGMDLHARTTSAFAAEFGVGIAVNGSFFEPFRAGNFLWNYYPHSGDPVDVKGLAVSNGETYSDDYVDSPVLCLSIDHAVIRHSGCPSGTSQALAGNMTLVEQGISTVHDGADTLHPRTAVAVNVQGGMLWLIVVDGRQQHYSEGVTLAELADIALELEAETVLNLDGGGSSTLVMTDRQGTRLLNAPIHTRVPMRQRPVANHLGVYALPVGKDGNQD